LALKEMGFLSHALQPLVRRWEVIHDWCSSPWSFTELRCGDDSIRWSHPIVQVSQRWQTEDWTSLLQQTNAGRYAVGEAEDGLVQTGNKAPHI